MSLVIRFNLGEHWCFGRWQEREFWESWLFFFSFLDLGLSYMVVWVVQDSVSFTQWYTLFPLRLETASPLPSN